MNSFKQILKLVLLNFILILITGCTLITKFDVYKLSPEGNNDYLLKEKNINVAIHLFRTESRKIILPLLYQKAIEKEPYQILISITGNIDKINPIHAKYSINEESFVNLNVEKDEWQESILSDRVLGKIV